METTGHAQGTLWSRWSEVAAHSPGLEAIVHWSAGSPTVRWTYEALIGEARRRSRLLFEQGVRRGDVCAIIMRHSPQFYPLYLACCHLGAIPAVLAYPNGRLHPDKFKQGLTGMSSRSGLDWVLTDRSLEGLVSPLVAAADSTVKGVLLPETWGTAADEEFATPVGGFDTEPRSPTDPLLLQHSSGTTGLQKPVVLSHRAVEEHILRYASRLAITPADKVVSWLPLYHDMGLIAAFHLPLAIGITSVQIDPIEWISAPSTLLEAVTNERGTISWLPNFAYDVMADRIRDDALDGIDLSSWRLVINCSEPVRHESHIKFLERFSRFGLQASALSTCYAMAETTFAVTQVAAGSAPRVVAVDRTRLAQGVAVLAPDDPSARLCVSSGHPISGCDVRIQDSAGAMVEDGIVGELAVGSVSLFDGYRNYPEKTETVLKDGWYFTGDLGFRLGLDHFIIGRRKDVIIVAGNNIYPEDVEAAVSGVADVIPGRVVAFGEDHPELGTEMVAVAAETTVVDPADLSRLVIRIKQAAMQIDVTIGRVHLVPPRSLIKSSSGKLSRSSMKERLAMSAKNTHHAQC